MDEMRCRQAQALFGVPEEFYEAANCMVQEAEWELVLAMGKETWKDADLRKLVEKNRLTADPYDFIQACYHRAVLDKCPQEENLSWKIGSFYGRYPYFAQFEYYEYGKFPRELKERLNAWDKEVYVGIYGEDVKAKMRGEETWVHNSTFLTLEEAYAFVEKHPDSIHLHSCNCKSMMYYHDRPLNVCMGLAETPNSEADRGYGEHLTVEQAKAKLREFNRAGLMQNGEDYAICNCDGYCCYPLHMARTLGSRGIYPKSNYLIEWHEEECIHCGKCTRICNFDAFSKDENGKVHYDPDLCWGCTICAENCPRKAIHLIPKKGTAVDSPDTSR